MHNAKNIREVFGVRKNCFINDATICANCQQIGMSVSRSVGLKYRRIEIKIMNETRNNNGAIRIFLNVLAMGK